MGKVTAQASKQVGATPERVLELLRDYRNARPRILPGNYSAYRVEAGGEGAGTVIAYHLAAGRRERDQLSSFVSTWKVAPDGAGANVTLAGSWDGAGGIAGVFEGLFAPLVLRRIYGEILNRLAAELEG